MKDKDQDQGPKTKDQRPKTKDQGPRTKDQRHKKIKIKRYTKKMKLVLEGNESIDEI